MKVGDMIRHLGDNEIGLIIKDKREHNLQRKGSVFVWWSSNCFAWYPKESLEVINENR